MQTTMSVPSVTLRESLWGRSSTLFLFGQIEGHNWSPGDPGMWGRLAQFVASLGGRQILAPKPRKDSRRFLCCERDLSEEIETGVQDVVVRRGYDADAVLLEPGQFGYFATADCPCVCIRNFDTGQMILSHCSRSLLLDGQRVLTLGSRALHYEHESIVYLLRRFFSGTPRQRLCAHIIDGIAGRYFKHSVRHPQYREVNKKLIGYVCREWGSHCFTGELSDGCLCLDVLIRRQLLDTRVSGLPNLDPSLITETVLDTFYDRKDGQYLWHSFNRHRLSGGDPERMPCNGVLVWNAS